MINYYAFYGFRIAWFMACSFMNSDTQIVSQVTSLLFGQNHYKNPSIFIHLLIDCLLYHLYEGIEFDQHLVLIWFSVGEDRNCVSITPVKRVYNRLYYHLIFPSHSIKFNVYTSALAIYVLVAPSDCMFLVPNNLSSRMNSKRSRTQV